jgi:hypothetical protein
MKQGFGFADYLLYNDRKAAGAIEAKPEGITLTGVEPQSAKYAAGLPNNLPAHHRPLPFLFESNGSVTYFTNGLDPVPRSRQVFNFPRPETLADCLAATAGEKIKVFPVLDDPSRSPQLGIYFLSRFLLGCFGHELNPRPAIRTPTTSCGSSARCSRGETSFARRSLIEPASRK